MSVEGCAAPASPPLPLLRMASMPCCTPELTAGEDITRSDDSSEALHECVCTEGAAAQGAARCRGARNKARAPKQGRQSEHQKLPTERGVRTVGGELLEASGKST